MIHWVIYINIYIVLYIISFLTYAIMDIFYNETKWPINKMPPYEMALLKYCILLSLKYSNNYKNY